MFINNMKVSNNDGGYHSACLQESPYRSIARSLGGNYNWFKRTIPIQLDFYVTRNNRTC